MQKRNLFDHSHVNSTTFKMGYVIPLALTECLPGDTWQGNTQLFMRVAPTVSPVMHRVNITTETIFVPIRILWSNFETFITGGNDGMDASVPPYVMIAPSQGSLADYFGLPLCESELKVSALPFRAYAAIYNWKIRDQDLQDELPLSLDDGEDTETSTELKRACWQKDYFTTARPWPQKGPSMTVPLTGTGLIVPDGPMMFESAGYYNAVDAANAVPAGTLVAQGNMETSSVFNPYEQGIKLRGTKNWASNGAPEFNTLQYLSGLMINQQTGLGVDINDLLESMAMQRMATRRSLFGSRYEDLLHFWGLKTQDFRLQEPELVAVGRGRLQFSEVLQTSPDSNGEGVGSMAGHGVGAMQSGRFRYYCHEHGYLITLLTVRPQAVYTQGIERMWTRETRWDYWSPEMQHIGQQAVLSKEVFADGTEADDEIFGYQNRFDEYRRGKNHVSGEFRTTQDFWNMARVFENRPVLNSEFVECDPTDRIFQLNESLSDQLYCMVQNNFLAKRLVSRNGNPM